MIYLYRQIKKSQAKKREAAAANANTDTNASADPSQPPALHHEESPGSEIIADPKNDKTVNEPGKKGWELWKPRVMLGAAVVLPCLLETLDYTVVATSQTNIASVFNRLDLQSYIGTAYVLGSTVFLPIWASFADVFGRYAAMQASVVIFLIGSVICTGALNMPTLLVGRGISGIGAAGLLTLVRIILSDSTSLDDNNAQGAILIVVYTVGYCIGPILGGVLLRADWRWVFAINLPICTVSVVLMHILLPKITKGPQPAQRLKRLPPQVATDLQAERGSESKFTTSLQRLDLIGAALFVIMGILFLLGLNWGSTENWNQPKVIACLAVGGAFLIPFIIWEWIVDHSTDHLVRAANGSSPNGGDVEANNGLSKDVASKQGTRARAARLTPNWAWLMDPMIPMNMFRSYDIIATSVATLASGMVMLAFFYFIAIFYVIVSGKDAVGAGVQLLYFAPGMGAGTFIAIRLIKIVRQPRIPIWIAHTILPIGVGFLAQALYKNNNAQMIGFMIMTGAGVGMGFAPLSFQARFAQPEDRVAVVIATNLFFRTLGGTIGLAQLSAVMFSRVRSYIINEVKSGRLSLEDAARIQGSLGSVGKTNGIFSLPQNLIDITTAAFRDGIRWAFFSLLPWLGLAWLLVVFLRPVDKARLAKKPGQPVGQQPTEKEVKQEAP